MSSGTYGRALRGAPRRALLAPARRGNCDLKFCNEQEQAAVESACRQYRAVRWFLLPEGELRPPRLAADCKNSAPKEVSSQYGISAEEASRPQDGN